MPGLWRRSPPPPPPPPALLPPAPPALGDGSGAECAPNPPPPPRCCCRRCWDLPWYLRPPPPSGGGAPPPWPRADVLSGPFVWVSGIVGRGVFGGSWATPALPPAVPPAGGPPPPTGFAVVAGGTALLPVELPASARSSGEGAPLAVVYRDLRARSPVCVLGLGPSLTSRIPELSETDSAEICLICIVCLRVWDLVFCLIAMVITNSSPSQLC